MPDLLVPCPCEGCKEHPANCGPGIGESSRHSQSRACGPYAAYAARKALLEALKAGGVKVAGANALDWITACDHLERKVTGPGHLIFIPEAQG